MVPGRTSNDLPPLSMACSSAQSSAWAHRNVSCSLEPPGAQHRPHFTRILYVCRTAYACTCIVCVCVCVLHKYRCNIEKTVETSRPDGDIKTACIGAPIHAYVLGCEREREREREREGERER